MDIPEHIALRVTTIENRAKALRLQQNDQLRHLSTLETLIGTLSEHHQTVHRLVQQKEVARDWVTGANPAGVNSASFSQVLYLNAKGVVIVYICVLCWNYVF